MDEAIQAVLPDMLSFGRIFGVAAILLITSCVVDFFNRPAYHKHLPRVGYGTGLWARAKIFFRTPKELKAWVDDGYKKYSKTGKSFVIAPGLGRRSALVLPRSQLKWFLKQPDNVLSFDEASNDSLYAKYNFLGDAHPKDAFNNTIVHRNLAKALSGLVPEMQEDIEITLGQKLGLDTDNWKKFNVWSIWLAVIPRVSNVMILGKDLGRNPEVVGAFLQFIQAVHHNMGILNMLFATLHHVVGPLLAIRNRRCFNRATECILPVIQKRLEAMERKATDPSFKWKEPEDAITWCIRQARAENNIKELQPSSVAKRLLLMELGSVFTTAITAQNALVDILSADPTEIEALREEAVRLFNEENQKWTQAGAAKLVRLDSAIRESQRRSNFAVTMLDHKVIAPNGLTNENEGWHVPYGAILSINLNGIYHDPEIYPDPEHYDPFRFSQPLESGEVDEKKKRGIVSTGEDHLVFGHGRHSCPGRFFVALELKMAIAYMLINYEIKHVAERPPGKVMGNFILPPIQASMDIRRRTGTLH